MTQAVHLLNSEISLKKADQQQYLFKSLPKRTELLKLKSELPCQEIAIRIHRNHSFESVASAINPFLEFGGYRALFSYSDYDDSLSFTSCEASVSIEIIWLDYDRYFSNDANDLDFFISWLAARINALREISKSPILINDWPSVGENNRVIQDCNQRLIDLIEDLPGVRICSQRDISAELGDKFFDTRSAKLTGTTWSDRACMLNARQFASHWLPASLSPRLKAIVVDLDLTLYDGVLGEDGVAGVVLTEAHVQLQQELLRLKESGIFLAIASRNEPQDVEELFRSRPDFPLKLADFAAIEVNWHDKAANITKIAERLRIGIDAILFVDDNPGEIAKVSEQLPTIWTLLASHQLPTVDILKFYPRLWAWETTNVDNLRLADLQATSVRDLLVATAQNVEDYWQALQVELDFHVNPSAQLVRLSELSQKTNQFNLTLARLSEVELSDYLDRSNWIVVGMHLRDRLSDSGTIGLIIGEKVDESLVIRELCISCRALGRHLEDIMIGYALDRMIDLFATSTVVFKYQKAPRNDPALKWLEQFTKVSVVGDEMEISLNNRDIPIINPAHLSALKINTYPQPRST